MEKLISLETQAARLLVEIILSKGFSISVYDGEEWTVRRSTSAPDILEALDTTGEDYLAMHRVDGSKGGGCIQLVWGNSAPELVADYTANDAMEAIWNEWHQLVDQ